MTTPWMTCHECDVCGLPIVAHTDEEDLIGDGDRGVCVNEACRAEYRWSDDGYFVLTDGEA